MHSSSVHRQTVPPQEDTRLDPTGYFEQDAHEPGDEPVTSDPEVPRETMRAAGVGGPSFRLMLLIGALALFGVGAAVVGLFQIRETSQAVSGVGDHLQINMDPTRIQALESHVEEIEVKANQAFDMAKANKGRLDKVEAASRASAEKLELLEDRLFNDEEGEVMKLWRYGARHDSRLGEIETSLADSIVPEVRARIEALHRAAWGTIEAGRDGMTDQEIVSVKGLIGKPSGLNINAPPVKAKKKAKKD